MKLKVFWVTVFSVFSVLGGALEKGAELPLLMGVNQEGKEVVVQAAEGNEWLLIFTYPKALTGG